MGILSVRSANTTPLTFLDRRRPAVMDDADKIYKGLIAKMGDSAVTSMELASRLGAVIKDTKSVEVEKFWPALEKEFNKGRPIAVKAKDDLQKLMTGFSLFYNAINDLDPKAVNSMQLIDLRQAYYDSRDYLEAKFGQSLTGKDKRTMDNIIYSTNQRIIAIARNYNKRIEAGTLKGPNIPLG